MDIKKIIFIVMVGILFNPPLLLSAHKHPEKYYQGIWCNANNGKTEVITKDNTRIDCETDTHAVEFDFGSKWAEAIGQSLHYSYMTSKRGGICLIIGKSNTDKRYLQRVKSNIKYHKLPIDVWTIEE